MTVCVIIQGVLVKAFAYCIYYSIHHC